MKKSTFFLLLAFWHLPLLAFQTIEGYWKNDRSGIVVHLEDTPDGIRAKRLDQTTWYHYTEIRDHFFRDEEGNTYLLLDNEILEWESRDGRKKIHFQRIAAQEYESDAYAGADKSLNIYGEEENISAGSLQGTWINRTTKQAIRIHSSYQDLEVKTRYAGWRRYQWNGLNTWRDHYGNQYEIRNGNLFFVSQSGDLIMRFERM